MSEAFVRRASGLVRSLNWWDSFGIGFGGVVLPVAMTSFYYAIPATLPHAHIVGGLLLLLIVLIPYLTVYTQLAFAMPRSGGDYIYLSRIAHPAIGFMQSWLATFIVALNLPMFSDMITTWLLPSFLTDLGYAGVAASLSNPAVRVIIDSLIMIVCTLMIIIPLRSYAKIQTILVILALVSTFVMLGALLIGHDAFVSMWNAASPTSYSAIIEMAKQAGYVTPRPNIVQTIMAAPILGFYLLTIWPVHVAGELKNVSRSITAGLFGAVLFSWAILTIGVPIYFGTVGFDFAHALLAIGEKSPVSPPLLNSLIGFVYRNPALSTVIDIGLLASAFVVIAQSILVITRWIFAWAFDRVAPIKLAEVHKRYFTPYITAIVVWIAGEFLLIVLLYTGLVGLLLNAALGSAMCFVPTLLAGMFLPWRRRDVFDAAPSFTRAKLGKVPLITICGAIGGFGLIAYLIILLTNPQLGFPVTPISGAFMIGYWILGILLYYLAKAYRKRQGIDIEAAFREIPPE